MRLCYYFATIFSTLKRIQEPGRKEENTQKNEEGKSMTMEKEETE